MIKSSALFGGSTCLLLGLILSSGQQQFFDSSSEEPPLPPINLPLISPEAVPDCGTFYSAAHEDWPPLPFCPYSAEPDLVPVYSLNAAMGVSPGLSFFLYDDRAVVAAEMLTRAAALESGLMALESEEGASASR